MTKAELEELVLALVLDRHGIVVTSIRAEHGGYITAGAVDFSKLGQGKALPSSDDFVAMFGLAMGRVMRMFDESVKDIKTLDEIDIAVLRARVLSAALSTKDRFEDGDRMVIYGKRK